MSDCFRKNNQDVGDVQLFPRLKSLGLIEAPARITLIHGIPIFPRLKSLGLIEARNLARTSSSVSAFPRLKSLGLIEAGCRS